MSTTNLHMEHEDCAIDQFFKEIKAELAGAIESLSLHYNYNFTRDSVSKSISRFKWETDEL